MAAPLKTSIVLSWLITMVAAGFGEPVIWEPSLEERKEGDNIRTEQRVENREGRKGMDKRGRVRQRREGITKPTMQESKEKTKQTRYGAFWRCSFDEDHTGSWLRFSAHSNGADLGIAVTPQHFLHNVCRAHSHPHCHQPDDSTQSCDG